MTIVPGVVVAFSKAFIPLIALLRVGRSVMYLKVINDIIKANPFPSIDRSIRCNMQNKNIDVLLHSV